MPPWFRDFLAVIGHYNRGIRSRISMVRAPDQFDYSAPPLFLDVLCIRRRLRSQQKALMDRGLMVIPQDGLWAPSHGRRACGGCGPAVKTSSATNAEYSVSCTTFNILAPIYKRLDKEVPSSSLLVPQMLSLNPVVPVGDQSSCLFSV